MLSPKIDTADSRLFQQVTARHVDEKLELSEQLEKSKTSLDQAVKERADEIADLKLLVGQHAAETLEARTLLQVIAACGGVREASVVH